jgi:hypothetical protein
MHFYLHKNFILVKSGCYRASVAPGAGVLLKADTPLKNAVSKPAVVVTAPKAGVLRINMGGGGQWPSVASSQALKGK